MGMYWGSLDSVWSDTTNWYNDRKRTLHANRIPNAADIVYLGTYLGAAGDCQLDVHGVCTHFKFWDLFQGYTGSFDMNGFTLTTFGDVELDVAGVGAELLMPGASELIATITNTTARYFSPIPDMVLGTVRFKFTNASGNARRFVDQRCTITTMIYEATGAGTSELYAWLSAIEVYGLQVSGAGVKELIGGAVGNEWRFHCDVDTRLIDEFTGSFQIGFDQDATLYLRSDLTFYYGVRWTAVNDEDGADRVITVATPDGQGGMYMPGGFDIDNRADNGADLHVIFSGDITRCAADYTKNLGELNTKPPAHSGTTTRLTLSAGIELLVQFVVDLTYATEVNGDPDTSFLVFGTEATSDLHMPDDVPVSARVKIRPDLVVVNGTLRIYGKAHLLGNLDIEAGGFNYRYVEIYGSTFRVDADITLEWDSTGVASIYDLYGAGGRWDFNNLVVISGSATKALVEQSGAELHVTGSLITPGVKWKQNAGGIHFHVRAAGGQKFEHTVTDSIFKALVVELDDPIPGVSDHDFFFDLSTAQAYFTSIQILNSLDRQFKVLVPGGGASALLGAGDLEIEGRGDPCSFPISDEYAVLLRSDTPGTQSKLTTTSSSFPTFTKFTDIDVDSANAFLDDGTCFDGGNNDGVTFESAVASMALCPVQSASFFAYRYGNIPAAQSFQVINLGIGDLAEPVASGLPSWLDATFVDNDDGTWTMQIQPNTTNLAAGTYEDTFDVSVAAARRSPQTFSVSYETSEDIIPLPDTDPVSFYQLRNQTYPTPQTIGVDNTYPAGGALQQIVVSDLPAWLDVEYTVPGPADHQEFKLTVNAVGLALDSGTYNANPSIDAPNAAEPYVMSVEMVVDRILIDTNVDQVAFSIKEGGALPYDEVINVSNSGTAGTLAGVAATPSESWLDAAIVGGGSGNNQNILVGLNAGAQALSAGTYTAQVTIASTNADNAPYTVAVELTILELEPFVLDPVSVEFTPGRDWALPLPQQVSVISTGEGSFVAPVTVTGAPSWLQVTVDALVPAHQIITLTPLVIPTDTDDFTATLVVTGSYSIDLPVSMVVPAFFRRPDCQMDFIPRIEGTIIEECEVPPPPPPAPALPPITPPQPAPTYQKNITMTGPPCIDCTAWVEYDDEGEVGYGKPHYYIMCDDHGCDGDNLSSGTYGSADNTPGGHPGEEDMHVTAIEIDECGHICGVWFDVEGS